MSASKPVTSHARKRKPYKRPALTEITLEDAKKALETRSDLTDRNNEKLLKEINRRLENH